MQLKNWATTAGVVGCLAAASPSMAQDQPDSLQAHYFMWNQSGGEGLQTFNGTEDETIIEPVGVLDLNLGKRWFLNAKLDVDMVSSASGQAPEIHAASGSSGNDTRNQYDVSVSYTPTSDLTGDRTTLSAGLSQSREYHYKSDGMSFGVSQEFLDRNFVLAIAYNQLDDTVKNYRITEEAVSGTEEKKTQNFAVSATQLLTRKSLINVSLHLTQQRGYLARSLNSVGIRDGTRQQERLPDARDRIALRVQYNQFLGSRSAYHLIYRYYQDTFDVQAHTVQGRIYHELPYDLEISGNLRYHTQTGVKYWAREFSGNEEFVTSDSDLEAFDSLYGSFTLTWKPTLPLPPPVSWWVMESDLRVQFLFGQYRRTNGLQGTLTGLSVIGTF